ncbi:alpha-2-macroglobulin-like [Psammomys obesus]|uniref:alpha-2-macroglobulin-like n=1 Tax=Psammomys obesus TaxID=48139 RepID=UPI002452A3FD|nr:alpha-2-macroglobulin-like [Psammomys obesus]
MGKRRLPQPSLVLLSLLLPPPTDAASSQKPIYMVLVPSLLHAGTLERGCLLFIHLNETVTVKVSVESVQGNKSLFTDLVVDKELFHCVTFLVPQSSSTEVMFLTVRVKGETHKFRKRSTVLVKRKESLVFAQTDKPIYKLTQTVKFCVVSLDEKFRPLNELIPLLYVQDPRGNRIAQWQSVKLESGLRQLSFPLSSEPPEGSYKLAIRTESGRTIEHPFSVKGFVLPKFEVKVKVPETITILDEEMRVSVCGNVGYCSVLLEDGRGTPIQYEMISIIANEANHYLNATTDKDGLVSFSINTDNIMDTSLTVRAKYKDNHVCYGFRWLTEEHVEAQHTASAVFSPSQSLVHLVSTPGKLRCDQWLHIQVLYILNGKAVQELKKIVFYYLLMARGGIVRSGTHELPVEPGDMKGHFSIFIPVETDLAPLARLLLFTILPGGEVVADTVKYEIGNCLNNKVTLTFHPNSSLPGTHTLLSVMASPNSLCALRAVDHSLLLLKPEAELSPSLVYNLLPVKDLTGFPQGADQREEDSRDCIKQYDIYINGILYSLVENTNEEDVYGLLEEMGLKVFTNSKIHKPKVCERLGHTQRGPAAYHLVGQNLMNDFLVAPESPKETIRTYFPESWIWDLVEAPSSVLCDGPFSTVAWEGEQFPENKDSTEVSEQISLKLPPGVVEDSPRASVTVLGDILGSAMQSIQNLLKMPYGCGEQNMVLFAPNIYVLDYLNETQQLTEEIKTKAIDYLNMGYQRQLNYKHQDGSYSTFGEKAGRNHGNTWLTAFVLKSFAQAQKYIFIHEAHITQALIWLSQQQQDNGCFRSSGYLFNNAMKGGVENEVILSAYITMALLEMSLPFSHPVVRNALFCLDTAWKSTRKEAHGGHVYTKALLAYAFALAGDEDTKKEILKSLDEEAVKRDNSIHWARPQKHVVPVGLWYQPRAPSAEVEMTAYVLLAYLTGTSAPTQEDLTTAMLIVKWLTKQQNSHGGFSSTQDTVAALHALSKYGAATFTRSRKTAQVTVYSSDVFSTRFQVDNSNQLLLQRATLPIVPGDYTAQVIGEGCVYLQTSVNFNVLPRQKEFSFALVLQTLPQTCEDQKAHTSFEISLNIRYTGSRSNSNMAIADVKMVSGFVPLTPTVKMLEQSVHVSRTEVSNNRVLIYLDKVSNQMLALSFTVQQDIPIKDLRPAIVKVYDYYEKDEFAVAEYSAPCSTGT